MKTDEMLQKLSFKQVEPLDMDKLAHWLTTDTWPWHGHKRPTLEKTKQWIADGKYSGPDNRPFWIYLEGIAQPVGLVCLEDLSDYTPIFDLRIKSNYRGRGLGRQVLMWLTEYVFTQTDKHRLEGHTRIDNIAMQRVFKSCNWVLEACYRQSWPDFNGTFYDALTYAVLKSDWESGRVTPVNWPR